MKSPVNKRRAAFSTVLLMTAAVVIGLVYMNNRSQPASELNKYKLAVFIPETGNLAFIGQPIHNALTIAIDENAKRLLSAGIKIETSWVDTQGNPREAVTAFNRVVDVAGANAVITTLSGVTSAVAPLAREKPLFLIGLTVDPSFLAKQQTAIRVFYSFEKEGSQLAETIINNLWSRVLILHSTDAATNWQINQTLVPALQMSGVTAVVDTFNVGQRDFKDLVAKYSGTRWDVVIYHGFGSELPFLAEAASNYPNFVKAAKLGSLGTVDVKPNQRQFLAGLRFFAPLYYAEPSDAFKKFSDLYHKQFPDQSLSYTAVYAYDAFVLLSDALRDLRTADPVSIRRYLLEKPRQALTQPYEFDASGDSMPKTVLLEVAPDGSFQRPTQSQQ